MTLSPTLLMRPVVILSVAAALLVLSQVASWLRVRRLGLGVIRTRIEDLENRQAALEALAAEFRAAAAPEPAETPSVPSPSRVVPRPSVHRRQAPAQRVDAAQSSAVSGPTLISVPSLSSPAPTSEPVFADLGHRFRPIWELADRGATPDIIARSTGQPIGQVELILALKRQLAAQAGEPRPS